MPKRRDLPPVQNDPASLRYVPAAAIALLPWAAFAVFVHFHHNSTGNPILLQIAYLSAGFLSGALFEFSAKNLIASSIFSVTTFIVICLGLDLLANVQGSRGGDAGMAVVFAWALAFFVVPSALIGSLAGRAIRTAARSPSLSLIAAVISALTGFIGSFPTFNAAHMSPPILPWPANWINGIVEMIYYAVTGHNTWWLVQNGGKPDFLWTRSFTAISCVLGWIVFSMIAEIRRRILEPQL